MYYKESLWSQWWVKLGLWVLLFSAISYLSPNPVIPGIFFIGSVLWWIVAKVFFKGRSNQAVPYYRGA